MPTIANIVVKDASSADVTFGVAASAVTDGTPAVYRCATIGQTNAERPTVKILSRANGKGQARRVNVDIEFPLYYDQNGLRMRKGSIPISLTVPVPQDVDAALVTNSLTLGLNILSHAQVRNSVLEAMAPR